MAQNSLAQHDCEKNNLPPGAAKTPDRMKRDEWSEEAVALLLDAYEAKWVLRNRTKLKGNDWEEVARQVCARNGGGSKSFKTQSQCKNKIEALKKRYRSEATNLNRNSHGGGAASSAWPFFARMDTMLRCPATGGTGYGEVGGQTVVTELGIKEPIPQVESGDSEQVLRRKGLTDISPEFLARNPPMPLVADARLQESSQEDASNTIPAQGKDNSGGGPDSDTSTPRSKIAHAMEEGAGKASAKRRKNSSSEVAESIRSFADSIVKLEEAKMEMYKDSERLRVEAEARRVEMELKRTEIIAKTQLQIAKILSGKNVKRKNTTNNNSNASTKAPSGINGASSLFRE